MRLGVIEFSDICSSGGRRARSGTSARCSGDLGKEVAQRRPERVGHPPPDESAAARVGDLAALGRVRQVPSGPRRRTRPNTAAGRLNHLPLSVRAMNRPALRRTRARGARYRPSACAAPTIEAQYHMDRGGRVRRRARRPNAKCRARLALRRGVGARAADTHHAPRPPRASPRRTRRLKLATKQKQKQNKTKQNETIRSKAWFSRPCPHVRAQWRHRTGSS